MSVLKLAVGAALVVGLAGGMAYGLYRYALGSERFAISELVVEGTRRLGRDEVLAVAGVSAGQNVFALDVGATEARLLETAWVREARVTRRLPGTVRIELVEHEAVALAVLGGKTFLVADGGQPFKELGAGDPHDLPVVTGLSPEGLARDRRAELERLAQALDLVRDFEALPIARGLPVQEVHLTPAGHAVLSVGLDGLALHLGAGPYKGKLLRAASVLERSARGKGKPAVVFLDNEAHPERVVVRLR
jgi:cell division protein FtsQ